MLEPKDLEAIDEMIQKRIGESETRTNQSVEEMWQQFIKKVHKRFDILEENQQMILEKLVSPARVEKVEEDVQVLKTAVRHLNGEVRELKAAK